MDNNWEYIIKYDQQILERINTLSPLLLMVKINLFVCEAINTVRQALPDFPDYS